MELSGDVGGKRVVVAHRGDVAVMKVEDGREMVDVDLRTDAGEVPSGLGWGFVGGWLLRRWKSAKTAEKSRTRSCVAQTAGFFPATQIPTA